MQIETNMEYCLCGEKPLYFCNFCKSGLCKQHKSAHTHEKNIDYSTEQPGVKLTSEQSSRLSENLSSKINLINICKQQLIDQTSTLLVQIQKMCKSAIDILSCKQNKCLTLLKTLKKRFYPQDLHEMKHQLGTSLSISISLPNLESINQFYTSDFLQESELLTQISSMSQPDAIFLLKESYDLSIQAHTDWVTSISITSDDKYIVSGSCDKTVRIWRMHDKIQAGILEGHTDSVWSIAITSDDKYIISGSGDKTLRLWSFKSKRQKAVFLGHTDLVTSVAVTRDSEYIVSGSADTTVRVWSMQYLRQEAVLLGHTNTVRTIVITPDKKHILSAGNNIRVWNLQEKRQEDMIGSNVTRFAIANDGKFVVYASLEGKIRIKYLEGEKSEELLYQNLGLVWALALTSDNECIVIGCSMVRIVKLKPRRQIALSPKACGIIWSIAPTKERNLVVFGTANNFLLVWRYFGPISSPNPVSLVEAHTEKLTGLWLIEGNPRRIVSASRDYTVRIWNLQTKTQEKVINVYCNAMRGVSITSDRKYVIYGAIDYTVKIWNIQNQREKTVFEGHTHGVTSLALTRSSKYCASGTGRLTVKIWKIEQECSEISS